MAGDLPYGWGEPRQHPETGVWHVTHEDGRHASGTTEEQAALYARLSDLERGQARTAR